MVMTLERESARGVIKVRSSSLAIQDSAAPGLTSEAKQRSLGPRLVQAGSLK